MNQKRTTATIKNIFTGFIQKLITLVCVFISRKLFIQYIGIDYLGINSLFANILSVLSMADLGFGVAIAYSLYKPLAEKDYETIRGLIKYYRKIYNIIAGAIFSIGLLLIPFLDYLVNLESDIPNLTLYYVIFLAQTSVSYLFVYKAALLNADQKSYIINNLFAATSIVTTALQILAIVIYKEYIVYIIIQLFAVVAQNVAISIKTNRVYPFLQIKEHIQTNKNIKSEITKNISSIFIYKTSTVLMNSVDNILISKMIGTVILGMYTNYLEVVTGIFAFLNIVFSSVTASIGNLVLEKNNEKSYLVFKAMQMISFYLSAIIIASLMISYQTIIRIWIGPEYQLSDSTVAFICLNFYLSICVMPLWSYREACGIYMKTKYIMLIAAGLNLILSIILGYFIGLEGIIAASVISRLVTYFWYEPKILFETIFIQKLKLYFIPFVTNISLVTITIYGFWFILRHCLVDATIWNIALINICLGMILTAVYYLLYKNKEEYLYVKKTLMIAVKR